VEDPREGFQEVKGMAHSLPEGEEGNVRDFEEGN
jgi:hypothetical protein